MATKKKTEQEEQVVQEQEEQVVQEQEEQVVQEQEEQVVQEQVQEQEEGDEEEDLGLDPVRDEKGNLVTVVPNKTAAEMVAELGISSTKAFSLTSKKSKKTFKSEIGKMISVGRNPISVFVPAYRWDEVQNIDGEEIIPLELFDSELKSNCSKLSEKNGIDVEVSDFRKNTDNNAHLQSISYMVTPVEMTPVVIELINALVQAMTGSTEERDKAFVSFSIGVHRTSVEKDLKDERELKLGEFNGVINLTPETPELFYSIRGIPAEFRIKQPPFEKGTNHIKMVKMRNNNGFRIFTSAFDVDTPATLVAFNRLDDGGFEFFSLIVDAHDGEKFSFYYESPKNSIDEAFEDFANSAKPKMNPLSESGLERIKSVARKFGSDFRHAQRAYNALLTQDPETAPDLIYVAIPRESSSSADSYRIGDAM